MNISKIVTLGQLKKSGYKTLSVKDEVRKNLIEKGWQHAQHFTQETCAAAVMNVYQQINNSAIKQ